MEEKTIAINQSYLAAEWRMAFWYFWSIQTLIYDIENEAEAVWMKMSEYYC